MGWQQTPYTVPFLLTGAITFAVILPVVRNRDQRAADPLILLLAAASLQCFASALRYSSTTLNAKLFWLNISALAATLTPLALFLLGAALTNRQQWLTRTRVLLLFALEGLLVVLNWTNPYHHLVRTEDMLVQTGSYISLDSVFGPLFFVTIGVQYLFLSVATYWLIREYWEARTSQNGIYARQVALLVCAVLIPWAGNVLFATGRVEVNLTVFAFAVTALLIAVALFRYRLLDVLPIARGTVVESMDNGVFVLDTDETIVDANPQATVVIGAQESELIGRSFADVFAEYPPLAKFRDAREATEEVSIERDGDVFHYQVKVSTAEDPFGNCVGRTLVFDDITTQVEREQALRDREEELDLMRQVLSRVLRHNIRNELQVVRARTEHLSEELDGEHSRMAAKSAAAADDVVALSNKARSIETLVEQNQNPEQRDICGLMTDIVGSYRREFPDVSFTMESPGECLVDIVPAVDLVFDNLVENAAEHNTATEPTAKVTITPEEDRVCVTISDNGPGIPQQELSVLDQGEETDLEHGSGLGLWVVNWVIDNSALSIEYDINANGSMVMVDIPR